jgi:hypothetical protein
MSGGREEEEEEEETREQDSGLYGGQKLYISKHV